jgi:hypothetical protein
LQATDPEKLEEYNEIADKYLTGEDELAPHVPIKYQNRNTSKGESTKNGENYNQ